MGHNIQWGYIQVLERVISAKKKLAMTDLDVEELIREKITILEEMAL